MTREVAVVGLGFSGFSSITPQVSYRELIYEAASRAYEEAGVNPRTDVGSFVCCEEDLWEGTSITDEYAPDQIGAAQRPTCTVTQDALNGVANAIMHIASGITEIAVVESHSKLSNVLSKDQVAAMALEPYYERPFLQNGLPAAALELRRYMHEKNIKEEAASRIVVDNKRKGLRNPNACYAASLTVEDVEDSDLEWSPIRRLHVSQPADGCVVAVLASASKAKSLTDSPIWISGIGWCSDSPWVSNRSFSAEYCRLAARKAYKMAGVESPESSFDFAEVDDTIAHKEIQHGEALGILRQPSSLDFACPVNPSGGSLAMGDLCEANGLVRLAMAAQRLRDRDHAKGKALVMNWRGVPTATGTVAVLEV
ncbi:MAG: acetyl-CoA acetyltransferase [Thermoprotei archaeon]